MSKTVVVFGASGTIGQGFIKATLEKGNVTHNFNLIFYTPNTNFVRSASVLSSLSWRL